MSGRGKKKTTMAKLTREARLRDRRDEKKAKKRARREATPGASVAELPSVQVSNENEGDAR